MKRMNVREFRKHVSHLDQEPIEVVRYSETIGFWVPRGMTLEPARTKLEKVMTDEEMRLLRRRLAEFRSEMDRTHRKLEEDA